MSQGGDGACLLPDPTLDPPLSSSSPAGRTTDNPAELSEDEQKEIFKMRIEFLERELSECSAPYRCAIAPR